MIAGPDALIARTIALAATFCVFAALYWGGAGENDSFHYIETALRWIESGPQLGDTHWSLRALLVAPMAAIMSAAGPSEFTAALPNFLYAAGLVAITLVFGARHFGPRVAFWSAMLVASSAFFVGMQIEIAIAGVEVFFAALSCWLFADARASDGPRALRLYALAGVIAGAAWLCRETTAFLPLALFAALAVEKPRTIAPYVAVGGGFAAVIVGELAFYAAAAGDPFYRYLTDLGHRGDGGIYSDYEGERPGAITWILRPVGKLLTDPAATPMLIAGAAALAWPPARAALFSGPGRGAARVFAIAGALSFLTAAYALNVKWPSYYPILAYLALLGLGAAIASLESRRGLGAASAVFALLALLNWAADDFRHYDELEEARTLARYAADNAGAVIATDHLTAIRARIFMRLAGEDARGVVSALESPGAICGAVYVANPAAASLRLEPHRDWRMAWRRAVRERRATHVLLHETGLAAASVRLRAIAEPPPPVALYQAPPCP